MDSFNDESMKFQNRINNSFETDLIFIGNDSTISRTKSEKGGSIDDLLNGIGFSISLNYLFQSFNINLDESSKFNKQTNN